jgi:dTDP-glucose pyrophosphorylase/predicted transcriptional regulator
MTKSTSSWREAVLSVEATLKQAVVNLNESATQIVLVVESDGVLAGTITDGDIRRGLLRGLNLDSPIDSIIHREAMVVPPQMGRDMVLHLMKSNGINALPVVDESRRVVGLHILNDIIEVAHRTNLMVVMAGGQGLRLRPHTENCPKPLLPVAGRPILEHIIERAKKEGFRHFVISLHYLGHMIEDYFGDGRRWGVNIEYLREDAPLGTAGAIGLLENRPTSPFVVTNGDVLTDIRYGELLDFHCRHGAVATMAVRLHEWHHPFGVVRTKGVDIVGFEEKPIVRNHINAGIYVLEPSALDVLAKGEQCDMPAMFTRLQQQVARTIVYPMHELWLDVGRPADYELANEMGGADQ